MKDDWFQTLWRSAMLMGALFGVGVAVLLTLCGMWLWKHL